MEARTKDEANSTEEVIQPKVLLKLLVDEKRNQVVMAEADRDFLDVICSFLTLPIGTVINTTSYQAKPVRSLGCMSNVYQSVSNIGNENFTSDQFKPMLLKPETSCESYCRRLVVNLDNSSRQSTSRNCNSETYEGVFFKYKLKFFVTDDLWVMPASPSLLMEMLSSFGLSDIDQIKEVPLEVGKDEISKLLEYSLVSNSALTSVFLRQQPKVPSAISGQKRGNSCFFPSEITKKGASHIDKKLALYWHNGTRLSLKVLKHRSTGKILFAEATDSFVDFLFGLLTFSLGSVVKYLGETCSFGCLPHLFQSLAGLDDDWFKISKETFLDAKMSHPYWLCNASPKSYFVKAPCTFIVLDDLVVKPLSSTSSVCFLRELQVPVSDIEEFVISLGEAEALQFMNAALTSPCSALTDGLSDLSPNEVETTK